MDRLIVARHGESEYNVRGLINADPSSPRSPPTNRGRRQARSLADRLDGCGVEVCVTSETLRAVQTAEIVKRHLAIPVIRMSQLDDPPAGSFEDGPLEAFAEWMHASDADALVPGTQSSLRDSARRYFEAARLLLARPERTVLVVAHAPALRWIVQAAQSRNEPLNYRRPLFAYAVPLEVDVPALRVRLELLAHDPFAVLAGERGTAGNGK